MRQIQPDLWETENDGNSHAYLWTTSQANVFFYNTTLEHEVEKLAELGGVTSQYLSHQDEIAPTLRTIRQRYGARLHCSAVEASIVGETSPVDDVFDGRRSEPHGFEVIPTPGHTPGSACFLVPSGHGPTYLFTGDTILTDAQGTWIAGYIPGYSDREAMVASFAVLADLTPDIVISSGFMGEGSVTPLGERAWADCVNEALRTLATA